MSIRLVSSLALALATANGVWAQTLPPVRPLGPILRVSSDSLGSVAAAIPLADGRVFVNDIVARRVLLFDSTLSKGVVVADSTGATANAYGPRPAGLIPFYGDSALLITAASLSMQVLTPAGTIGRIMAMPGSGDATGITSVLGLATPQFDMRGRIAHRLQPRPVFFNPTTPQPTGPKTVNEFPDSAAVARYDLTTRKSDTVAWFKTQKSRSTTYRDVSTGRTTGSEQTVFPYSVVDDWTMMPDGSIAVLRGHDYHVDWLNPDGSWSASPKIPFDWDRLNDDRKITMIDSTIAFREAQFDSMIARMQTQIQTSGEGGVRVVDGGARGGGGGTGAMTVFTRSGDGERAAGSGAPPAGVPQITRPVFARPPLNDVPDYVPPFLPGSLRADRDGNLWIRTTKMVEGRPVYDIVSREGKLTDRVQLPAFRTIAGFGPGGVVYLAVIDSTRVVHLEKAKVKRDS